MTKILFRFFVENQDLVTFLKKQNEFTSFIIKVLEDYRTGKLVTVGKLELDVKIKEQRLKKLTAEALIKELELKYWQTFHKTPTFAASIAIKDNVSNEKPLRNFSEKELAEFLNHVKFSREFEGYKIVCRYCPEIIFKADRLEAINQMATHLTNHGKMILAK